MSTTYYATVDEGPGPILIDHTTASNYVIHGAYGMAPVTPAGATHVTFTWSQATPYEVTVHFTQPDNGRAVVWSFARGLLREGGGEGDVQLLYDFADPGVLWLTLTRHAGQASISLNADWVQQLLCATNDIVSAAAEWDCVQLDLSQLPPDGGEQ